MKTWKKIEETKRRAADINNLKRQKEEKIQQVSRRMGIDLSIENNGNAIRERKAQARKSEQLHHLKAKARGKKENSGRFGAAEERRGKTNQIRKGTEPKQTEVRVVQNQTGKQNEEPDSHSATQTGSNEDRGGKEAEDAAGAKRNRHEVPRRRRIDLAENERGRADGNA